jgi:hypothetical protein
MNIKGRINKLEERAGTKSVFCECKQTNKYETYKQTLKIDGQTTEPVMMSNPVPKVCPLCNRETEKTVFIIQGVESNIPKPETM